MKKLLVGVFAASALLLTSCGAGDYVSDHDWDMNNPSVYNNNTYCNGGVYNPLPNNQYSCSRNGVTTTPQVRPAPVVPKNPAPKQNNTVPKPPSVPKPAPPAPKPPAPKAGK